MIALCKETNPAAQSVLTLVLTPNRSMDWHGNLQVILALAILITIGATPLVLMGGWVVILFALLQILLLTVGLYITLRKLEYHEVLTLQGGQLSFQRGSSRREGQFDASSTFPKYSVNILVEEHEQPMSAPDIDLIADGHCYPLGEFLNRDDRFKLEKILENQLNLRISHLNSFHRVSF